MDGGVRGRMNQDGKIWGLTTLIEANPFLSLHRAEIKAGGFSSKHLHATKANGFYVERGILKVVIYRDGLEDITVLRAGDYTAIDAGIEHRFECVEPCVLFELYWPAFNHNDITRADQGGVMPIERKPDVS